MGAPKKFTADDERRFLATIDKLKAKRQGEGFRATDSWALTSSIANYYYKIYLQDGHSVRDAQRLAMKMARGKLFRTRRAMLSRLRSAERKRSR
jgi:hypothetical protein